MSFREELEDLLNKYNQENESNTPDFILVYFILDCLTAFNTATKQRAVYYDKPS